MKKLKHKVLADRFAEIIENETEEAKETVTWAPSLSPTQQKIFDDSSNYILAYGERGSGKTFSLGGHKLVRHCYENFNALALIIVGVRSQATLGGVWHKLQVEILPEWKQGINLHHTDERQDTQKNLYIDIENRFGGYSKVVLISVPYGAFIKDRVKGFEPSLVFVDELTNLDTADYFNAVVQQLGRRQGIDGPQQYLAACNPDGPSHWVYKRFFEEPWDEVDGEKVWNDDYSVYHVPIKENEKNLPPGYYKRILEAVKTDKVEEARMIRGEWVDRPAGDAIFGPYFNKTIHLKGDAKNTILPNTKFPIIMGWDPGAVNNAIIFMQALPGVDKTIWTVFDEFVVINKKLPYINMIPLVMRKMSSWNRKMSHDFQFIHISDNSAFNQYRAKTGSYDVKDIEEISRAKSDTFKLNPIRMKAAPKFSGSVEARVRLTISKLQSEEIYVSAQCTAVVKMFRNLVSEKPGKTYDPNISFKPKRSIYLHAFDAMTYPIMYNESNHYVSVGESRSTEIMDLGGF
jgi:phage terminase large subunit